MFFRETSIKAKLRRRYPDSSLTDLKSQISDFAVLGPLSVPQLIHGDAIVRDFHPLPLVTPKRCGSKEQVWDYCVWWAISQSGNAGQTPIFPPRADRFPRTF